jgi:CheY-like chemotaxis protein
MTLKKYTISLDGLLEHEKLIFKLICSVSERTKTRTCAYTLKTDNINADIYINDIKNKNIDKSNITSSIKVWISDTKDELTDTVARPLIATRVLHTLDNLTMNVEPLSEIKSDTENNEINTTTSNLSEEEASELAIVHDDILENPANQEEPVTPSNPELTLIKNSKHIQVKNEKTQHVLVVDDSQSVRKQLELELDLFNVTVDYADSAKSALELLNNSTYDLALLDVVLPDRDGFHICKHIKATNKETIAIMLTGKATQADKIKGSLAGCDDYLVKPVGHNTFQNAVKSFIPLKNTKTAIEA